METNQQMAASENMNKSSVSLSSHHHHIPHHIRRHRAPSGGEEQDSEPLDPRIQVELEKLNRASEEINRLELELDDARAAFRQILSDSTQCLNNLVKRLGSCVDKSRPYHDAKMKLQEAHLESQKAVLKFERSCSMHEAAKEMVQLAEEGYRRREQELDPTWQEMLNYATMKVNEAEKERIESEEFHQKLTFKFKGIEQEVQKLEKDLKRSITKSKAYFDMKAKFNQMMEEQKRLVSRLEEDIGSEKALYSQALHSLEVISDSIHQLRFERKQKEQLGARGMGVGAEAPSPPPIWEKGISIDGSATSYVCETDAHADQKIAATESVPDLNQLKLTDRSEAITCMDAAFFKKILAESTTKEKNIKSNPPDNGVFETYSPDPQSVSSTFKYPAAFHSPSVIHAHDKVRNSSYMAAIESSQIDNPGWTEDDKDVTTEVCGHSLVTSASDSLLKQADIDRLDHEAERVRHKPEVTSCASRQDSVMSASQHYKMQHYKMYVKSESSSVSSSPVSSQSGSDLPTTPANNNEYSQNNVSSHSPSTQRKSPKLQGLILQVDANGWSPASTSNIQEWPGSVHTGVGHHGDKKPKLVVSTQHPVLGVFVENPVLTHQQRQQQQQTKE